MSRSLSGSNMSSLDQPRRFFRQLLWDCVFGIATLGVLVYVGIQFMQRGNAALPRIEERDGEIHCDLGDVLPDSKTVQSVPIWNRTKSPLKIKSITKSCSCLDVALSAQTIVPREIVQLKVALAAPTHRTGFEHRVVIHYEGDMPATTVKFVGTVSAWIQPDSSVIDFGELCAGEVGRKTVRFQVADAWPRNQSEFTCSMPSSSIENIVADASERKYSCTVNFLPPAASEASEVTGDLVLRWPGREGRRLNLPCRAKITPAWVAEPPAIVLGKLIAGQSVNYSAVIHRRKKSAEPANAKWKIEVEPSGEVSAQFHPDNSKSLITGSIHVSNQSSPGLHRALLVVKDLNNREVTQIPIFWESETSKE